MRLFMDIWHRFLQQRTQPYSWLTICDIRAQQGSALGSETTYQFRHGDKIVNHNALPVVVRPDQFVEPSFGLRLLGVEAAANGPIS